MNIMGYEFEMVDDRYVNGPTGIVVKHLGFSKHSWSASRVHPTTGRPQSLCGTRGVVRKFNTPENAARAGILTWHEQEAKTTG